ncbi:hypothetical protein CONPUDRAFT_148902 [Coniophora puteana RWD-64-598 SS2]|uniref:Uncharacterized protein n=1 Tax=Coniophora puteana (strain RWD-64-598) TaxID=741705 RepID=A0A5M3N6K8_CONPW|nr:uncharacterized protein CONPUDRAFT_148902 [Coniophora puteana RWD-64-598 SS2]EIW86857.1 hypothetical protein CONPUDRAFT_148902 [Coniophora puteana RWD-64-598 SS2]
MNHYSNGITHGAQPQHESFTALLNQPDIPPMHNHSNNAQWHQQNPQTHPNHVFPQQQNSWNHAQHQQQQPPPNPHPQIHIPAEQDASTFPALAQNTPFPAPNPQAISFASFLQPNVVQDLIRLSTPVGQFPNDDLLLTQALADAKRSGKSYRQALDNLHGVNNHSANLWKDYYLDHHDRFEILVARAVEQPVKTVKKPYVSFDPSRSRESSLNPQQGQPVSRTERKRKSSPPPSPPPAHSKGKARSSSQTTTSQRGSQATASASRPPKRSRHTMNSLSAPLYTHNNPKLPPPHMDIQIPDPPSRSPTPPTLVVSGTHGNKYTPADRDYFIKFISWRLKNDPSLNKKELCELLEKKAPHHTSQSWSSHWHARHDVADKILAAATARLYNEVKTEEPQSIPYDSPEEVEADEDSSSESESIDSDYGSVEGDTEDDVKEMGQAGSSYTRGDFRVVAKHIARTPNWENLTAAARWDPLAARYPDGRHSKSWNEFYRRNDKVLLGMVRKIRRMESRTGKQSSVKSQRGRPSWASKGGKKSSAAHESDSEEDAEYDEEGATDDETGQRRRRRSEV